MATETEVTEMNLRGAQDLCKLVEMLGYRGPIDQLACSNGAYVSSLLAFFDDNPGAMEAVQEFIKDNIDGYELDEEDDEEDEEE